MFVRYFLSLIGSYKPPISLNPGLVRNVLSRLSGTRPRLKTWWWSTTCRNTCLATSTASAHCKLGWWTEELRQGCIENDFITDAF